MKKRWVIALICLLWLTALSGCKVRDDSTLERSGDWEGVSDLGTIQITVNPEGTAVIKAVVVYTCSLDGIDQPQTLTLSGDARGWEITDSRFLLAFSGLNGKVKISGRFNDDATKIKGRLDVQSCSAKWEAIR